MHAPRHVDFQLFPLCRPGTEGGDLGLEFFLVGGLMIEASGENAGLLMLTDGVKWLNSPRPVVAGVGGEEIHLPLGWVIGWPDVLVDRRYRVRPEGVPILSAPGEHLAGNAARRLAWGLGGCGQAGCNLFEEISDLLQAGRTFRPGKEGTGLYQTFVQDRKCLPILAHCSKMVTDGEKAKKLTIICLL